MAMAATITGIVTTNCRRHRCPHPSSSSCLRTMQQTIRHRRTITTTATIITAAIRQPRYFQNYHQQKLQKSNLLSLLRRYSSSPFDYRHNRNQNHNQENRYLPAVNRRRRRHQLCPVDNNNNNNNSTIVLRDQQTFMQQQQNNSYICASSTTKLPSIDLLFFPYYCTNNNINNNVKSRIIFNEQKQQERSRRYFSSSSSLSSFPIRDVTTAAAAGASSSTTSEGNNNTKEGSPADTINPATNNGDGREEDDREGEAAQQPQLPHHHIRVPKYGNQKEIDTIRNLQNARKERARAKTSSNVRRALYGNLFICTAKLGAWLSSGSSSMMSEFVHSVVDCGNQALLLIGLRDTRNVADKRHPYGTFTCT